HNCINNHCCYIQYITIFQL
ncbi:hypothetical protein AZ014_001401, partial [Klebsiella pneumoniae]